MTTKGQLISKCLLGIFNSSKKRAKQFALTMMVPQVELFSFVVLEELKPPKRHFEINWPLEESMDVILKFKFGAGGCTTIKSWK